MNSPYLALDFGSRRTGVALSVSGQLVEPLTVLTWTPPHLDRHLADIVHLVRTHEVATIVVGMPLGDDGSETERARITGAFIERLTSALETTQLDATIVTQDEYGSSLTADSHYPDVARDAAAAAVILQDFLEEHIPAASLN